MPSIPQYTKTVIKRRAVADATDPNAVQSAMAPYQAMSDVAKFGADIAFKEKQIIETTKFNEQISAYKKDLMLMDDRLRKENSLTPEGYAGLFEEESKKLKETYKKNLTTPFAKNLFEDSASQYNDSRFDNALTWQRTQSTQVALDRVNKSLDNHYDRAFAGEDLNSIFKDIDASTIAAGTLVADKSRLVGLNEGAREKAVKARIDGFLSRGDINGAKSSLSQYKDTLGSIEAYSQSDKITKVSEHLQSKAKAELEKEQSLQSSRIDLAIEKSENAQDLFAVSNQIDNLENIYGEEWANKKRIKVDSNLDVFKKENNGVQLGASLVFAGQPINTADKEQTGAVNEYYKAVTKTPEFANLPPEQKNEVILDITKKSGYVPSLLVGELKAASISNDINTITQAANFKESLTATAPMLLPQIGKAEEFRRIDMINTRINSGMPANEAIEKVDKILDPKNAPQTEAVNIEIKEKIKDDKIDFRDKAVKSFRTYGDWWAGFIGGGMDDESLQAKIQLDSAAVEYRIAWEDSYRKTRDAEQANKEAREAMGLWGRTDVNPKPMVTKFPIEMYYGIENQDNDWIRDQAIEDVVNFQLNDFMPLTRDELKEGMFIVPHPTHTRNTAALGAPEYSIMVIKDGVPINPIGDRYWKPDVKKKREELVRSK